MQLLGWEEEGGLGGWSAEGMSGYEWNDQSHLEQVRDMSQNRRLPNREESHPGVLGCAFHHLTQHVRGDKLEQHVVSSFDNLQSE